MNSHRYPFVGLRIGRRKFGITELIDRYARAVVVAFFVEILMRMVTLKKRQRITLYGHAFDGNLKALADYLHIHHPDIEVVFMVDSPTVFRSTKRASMNSIKIMSSQTFKGLLAAATSKVIVTSHGPISLRRWLLLSKRRRPLFIDTWHGVGYKAIVGDAIRKLNDYDSHFIPSSTVRKFYEGLGINPGRISETGFARTDQLVDSTLTKQDRKKLLDKYGLSQTENRKLILIAPTWNETAQAGDIFPFGLTADEFFNNMAGFARRNKALILFRPHLNTSLNIHVKHRDNLRLVAASDYPEVEPLLLLCDILVTDWSSIISEYLILNRPIIFIDRDPSFRGEMAPLNKQDRPGAVVATWAAFSIELTNAISSPSAYLKRFESVREQTLEHAWGNSLDGKSAERYVTEINRLLGVSIAV